MTPPPFESLSGKPDLIIISLSENDLVYTHHS